METGAPAARREVAGDAASVAAGSGIVFAAGIVDQALRLAVTWMLASALGAESFGLYTYAVTMAVLLGTVAPIGLQNGVVLFAARYLRSGEDARLRGTIRTSLGISALSGAVMAAGVLAAGQIWPGLFGDPRVSLLIAPAVMIIAVLLVLVGLLRAARDMRSQAIAFQITLPVVLVLGSLLALRVGAGALGVVVAFVAAYAAGMLVSAVFVWRRYRGVLRAGESVSETRELLAFSIPQSVADIVYRLTLWTDVLLLGQLAGLEAVGLYRVAASIAMLGNVPVMAVHATFNPMVAELVYVRELDRLDALLKVVTRWLVVLMLPAFLVVLLLPDLLLGLFDPTYVQSRDALVVLMLGQAIHVSCAAAVPLIPMAGRSKLEMANGVVALALNVGLNLLLVPHYGPVGAAVASAVSLGVWAVARVVEARILLGCFPFDRRTLGPLIVAVVAGAVAAAVSSGAVAPVRIMVTVAAVAVFGAAVVRSGLGEYDRMLLDKVVGKLRRR